MKNMFKRITSSITALAMTLSLCNGIQLTSFADEYVDNVALVDEIQFSTTDYGLSDDELLLGYFENKLYGIDGGISTFAIANSATLTGNRKLYYDKIKAAATEIAAGERDSSTVTFELTWTPADAGVSSFTAEGVDMNKVFTDLKTKLDSSEIMAYLLVDCPYEFYWYDKVVGMSGNLGATSYTSTALPVTYELNFAVGKEYAGATAYSVNTEVTSAASIAADNAQSYVTQVAGDTDLERLTAYKDVICNLVSYDYDALANINNRNYGIDPWQIIHVFDNDKNTNVVCEGYAKAFQYLCDLDGGLECYSVSGVMDGGTGAGGHMWNIVTLGGKNYLVDVTNCDGDSNSMSIGYPDELFLKGMTEITAASEYSRTIEGNTITFVYDDGTEEGTSDMAALFGTGILTLSEEDYSEEITVSSIAVTTNPAKTAYSAGDAFAADGLVIKVNYSDGTSEIVEYSVGNAAEFSFAPSTIAADTTVVTVTYGEKTAEIPVSVNKIELEAEYQGPTEFTYADQSYFYVSLKNGETAVDEGTSVFNLYKIGETENPVFTSEGMSQTASGQSSVDYLRFENTDFYDVDAGKYDLHFNYIGTDKYASKDYGKIAEITVNRIDEYELNITVNTTVYTSTDVNDVGMSAYANIAGTYYYGMVEFADTVTGFTTDKKEYEVIFTPDNITSIVPSNATVTINVVEDVLEKIAVSGSSTVNKNYTIGETFNPAGLVITATYTSGNKTIEYTEETKNKFTFTPAVIAADTTSVTVMYDGKSVDIPVTVSNVITITEDMLENQTGGTGWKIENSTLILDEGYVFVIDKTCSLAVNNSGTIKEGTFYNTVNNRPSGIIAGGTYINTVDNYGTISGGTFPTETGFVYNYGTISGGNFTAKVYNRSKVTGGTFKEIDNDETLGTIELTTDANGDYSAAIKKTTDDGKVTVDGVTHTHTLKVKSYNNFTDDTHNKNEVCENCPVNYVKTTENEAHEWVCTSADVLIRTECICGYYGGMFKLEEPTDLTYDGSAKEVSVTAIDLIADIDEPTVKYYDVNGNEAEPINAGTYTAQIKIDDETASVTFTIEKATPDIGDVTVTPNFIYDSMTIDDLVFKALNSKVAGEVTADEGQTLIGGQFNNISWTFTPDNDNYISVTGTEQIMVNVDTIKSISVKTAPSKTKYMVGESFDAAGLVITAAYNNGSLTKDFAYADYAGDFTVPSDPLEYGASSVTIGYGGKTADIPVTVEKRTLEVVYSGKTTFKYGETDALFVTLKDGETEIGKGTSTFTIYKHGETTNPVYTSSGIGMTGEFTGQSTSVNPVFVNNGNASKFDVGTYDLYFTYNDNNDTYIGKDYGKIAEITVEKVVPEVKVTASSDKILYTSSTTADVTLNATATNTVSDTAVAGTVAFDGTIEFMTGTNNYPVIFTPSDKNYDPVETTVSIEIAEDVLESIAITAKPSNLSYVEGDKFDATGLVVTATYASGATKVIDNSLLAFAPTAFVKGDTSVTVSYGGKTAEITGIIVKGKLAASDFDFMQPESRVYDKAAKAVTIKPFDDVTGVGEITVSYYEGNTKLSGAPTDAGTYTVTIDVAEGTGYAAATGLTSDSWTFTIDKADTEITPSLSAPAVVYDTTAVEKITLASGTDVEGTIKFDGEITLSSEVSSYPVIFIPKDSKNYNEEKGTVTIKVQKDVITKITIKTNPSKTKYIYGEKFEADGLSITVTYTSGNTEVVNYADKPSEFSFSPDELTVATQNVTVTYAEKTAEINIEVIPATPSYTVPANLKATYGDTLADVALPEGWSWSDPNIRIHLAGEFKSNAVYDNGDPNYNTVFEMLTINVSKRTIFIDDVTVNNKIYDGKAAAVVNNVTFTGIVNDDKIDYTATAEFADKNAGVDKAVTVTVTINSSDYVLDNNTFTTTATINKADPDVTIPTTVSAITGLPLSKAKLPDGWVWDDATVIPVDAQTYGATYTPDDTTNYNTLTVQVKVTVSDCTHSDTTDNIKEPTCTEEGLKTTICNICDKTVSTEAIPAEHKWNSSYTVDTEATCTTDGAKSIHCKNCTEIKPDSTVKIPAGHKWNEHYSSDNTNHWIDCVNCDETKETGAHSFGYSLNSYNYCAVCRNRYETSDDEPVVIAPGAGTVHSIHTVPKPTEPKVKGENGKYGWDVISDELALAVDGDTVVVDMNNTTKLPKAILEDIEGRNIYLVLDMGRGIIWTINGETVTAPKAVDLRVSKNVKRIPVDVIDNVTGDNFSTEISLAYNGEFGFEAMLTISLGRKYNDNYANLYYYNPSDKAMEFIDCDLIANGEAQLIFNHASDYAIVIDEEALGDDVSSAAGVAAESKTMGTETVSVVFALPLVLAAGFVIRKKLCK